MQHRQRLAALYSEGEILRLLRARTLTSVIAGADPGPVASIQKLLSDQHGQHVMELAKDLCGAAGMLSGSGPTGRVDRGAGQGAPTEITVQACAGVDPIWHYGWLFAPALTLGGGTWAVQRNIIAERTLGLPREQDPSRVSSWREARRATSDDPLL
jgi:alkylation response protein AidB-like acyl-CoA dehydrogenase